MFRSSAALAALSLAGSAGFAAANTGCASVVSTANESGLSALTGALDAATASLLQTEAGPLIVTAASLDVDLPVGQRVTLFAPTDAAFQAAADKFGGELPQDAIANVLLNHIVLQELTSEMIVSLLGENGGSVVVSTALGSELFVSTDGTSIFVQSGGLEAPGATVTLPDQLTCAGPIHVIDMVLLPTMPDGTVVDFAEAAPAVAPAGAPTAAPAGAPTAAPAITPPAATEPTLAPSIAISPGIAPESVIPGVAPVALPPSLVDIGPGAGPVEGPALGDRGFDYFDYANGPTEGPEPAVLGDEPMAGPEMVALGDEPMAGPEMVALGDEPMAGPEMALFGDEPMEGPAEGPMFADGPGSVEGGSEGSLTVQEEADSAFSAHFLSSTAAAVATAVLVLIA